MVIHQFNKLIRNKWVWGVFAVAISAFFAFDFLVADLNDRSPETDGGEAGTLAGEKVNAKTFTALAEEVRMTVAASLQKENGRQIKGAGSEIYVLDNAPCTAILVECGFLSNPSELAMLKTEEYQSKIAACIFTGAANYMSKTITEEVN